MIASFPQFELQAPDLYPTRAVCIPELLHGNGGGQCPLIGSLEHRIHLLGCGEEKHADVLLWHMTIEAQHTQHTMKRVERAWLPAPGGWLVPSYGYSIVDHVIPYLSFSLCEHMVQERRPCGSVPRPKHFDSRGARHCPPNHVALVQYRNLRQSTDAAQQERDEICSSRCKVPSLSLCVL